jgi:hypothetical protein
MIYSSFERSALFYHLSLRVEMKNDTSTLNSSRVQYTALPILPSRETIKILALVNGQSKVDYVKMMPRGNPRT